MKVDTLPDLGQWTQDHAILLRIAAYLEQTKTVLIDPELPQKCQFLRRNLLLTIYNLSLASSTHDLEASLGLDLVRGATTRDNLAVTRKRRSPYLRHRLASFLTLVHLSCPCLALL